ncbi:XdhC family protein [Streptomyces geranii]|uniref:XdhC family protein n=1 Tax=Streptomyces geranii TaxID=2058923 RepID=UPI000D038FA1|nr:XdhC family protein [Streptomyces geranii]
MLNIADTLYDWCRKGRPFALATVVEDRGSARLRPGTAVAVSGDGSAEGNVFGACVGSAVHSLCGQVLADRAAPARVAFGCSDPHPSPQGLICGGEIDILVQYVAPHTQAPLASALASHAEGRSLALAQIVDGPGELVGRILHIPDEGAHVGTLGTADDDRAIVAHAREVLKAGSTARIEASGAGGSGVCVRTRNLSVLVHVLVPPGALSTVDPRMAGV